MSAISTRPDEQDSWEGQVKRELHLLIVGLGVAVVLATILLYVITGKPPDSALCGCNCFGSLD